MIGANPVVVISGKGGCGKTTVVSAVFQYAERLIALEIIKWVRLKLQDLSLEHYVNLL